MVQNSSRIISLKQTNSMNKCLYSSRQLSIKHKNNICARMSLFETGQWWFSWYVRFQKDLFWSEDLAINSRLDNWKRVYHRVTIPFTRKPLFAKTPYLISWFVHVIELRKGGYIWVVTKGREVRKNFDYPAVWKNPLESKF